MESHACFMRSSVEIGKFELREDFRGDVIVPSNTDRPIK